MESDLLYGARAIAQFLGEGVTERAVYSRAAKGEIPTFRMGKTLCASKAKLNDAIGRLARGE